MLGWSVLAPRVVVRAGARLIPLLDHASGPPPVLHGGEGCPRLVPDEPLILLETVLVEVLGHELDVLEATILAVGPLLRRDNRKGLITAGESGIGHVRCTARHIVD